MKLKLLFLTFLFSAFSWGQSVVISQYIETNSGSTPKGIEIFNVSGADIVFSAANNLEIYQGTNGAACTSLVNITSGTLLADEVWVVGTSDLTAYATTNGTNLSGTTTYAFSFNGDDALQVHLGGVLEDQFGVCGSDPGSSWTGGGVSTANNNLQILDGLCAGDTDGWTDPSERFTQIAVGTDMTGFGNAPASCSGPITYSVTYDGNGNDSGTVPVDGNAYNSGDLVTVLGNTGSLGLTGYTFNGWNTAADGSGTSYVASDTFNITANTTLYAQWLNTSPPVITSSLVDSGTVGAAYTYNIIATNSPTSYSATGLPAGLSINTATGEITGTVGTAGVYNVDITATNAYGSDTQTLVITFTVGPCHSEAMDNLCVTSCSPASSTYGTRTWAGDGGTWTSTDSRSDQVITASNPAVTIRNGSITSPTFTDGIGSITMTTVLPFSDSAGTLDVKVNGVSVGTIPYSSVIQTSTISGININGSVIITIESTNTARITIDDIEWTCYSVNNEIDVEGNSVSIVDGDTTPSTTDDTDFGTTLVGVDVSHTFTITNAGPDDLDISGITITGVDAADFYVSINPASTVVNGGSTTFEITFSPAAAGTSNATINIANNDSDENPYTFDITGEAITCTPTTSVSSITPASGPAGTLVTINGSGFATATDVAFGAYTASFTIVSGTVIEAVVPAGATTGDIVIQDAGGCELSYSTFTVIVQDNSTCDPTSNGITDLFISEVTDASSGSLSYIQIFNGTGATVDMTDYSVLIRNNGSGTGDDIPLTGTLVSGGTFVLATSVGTACAVAGGDGTYADQNDVSSGVNNNDCIHLDKLGTIIDTWGECDGSSWIGALGLGTKGYDFKRNPTATPIPSTTFVATDWTIVDFDSCSDNYDLINTYQGIRTPPSATTLGATYGATCTSATVSVTGTEAVSGGAPLTYQWYYSVPGDTGWTMVSNGGIYSGATSDTLSISDITGLEDYQYYCQIMEDTATCFIASDAVQINGSASTTWNGTAWSNGAPNASTLAIIDGDYDTTVNGDIECCSLVVNSTYTLDIQAVDYVEIQYNLTVNGTLNVWDDGSLVQVDDTGVNTGDISYERITTGTALDYVYWSSPVDGVNTPSSGYVFSWSPDFANPNSGWGYWLFATNTTMSPGVGYIMRDVFTNTFTGVARNGVIQPSISRANYTGADFTGTNGVTITNRDDNWNLIGNPYPSAINALDFLTLNTNIEGAVRIWTHGTSPSTAISDPVYDDFVANYTVADYIVYNGTGTISGPAGFNGFIAGGQSFMVNMNDGAATTETVTFNNSMRDKNHNNEQFYRQSSNLSKTNVFEKHRIWLDISNEDNSVATRTLVGYVTNATHQKDRLYDAVTNVLSPIMNIYSLIGNERMSIQGRQLPFDNQDIIPLGINLNNTGLFTISIGALDGLFSEGQDIYLEDKELGIIYDLKQAPYSFFGNQGEWLDRFVLRFTNNKLSQENSMLDSENVNITVVDNSLSVISGSQKIKDIKVYNVLGQLLLNESNINKTSYKNNSLEKNSQALIVMITFENDTSITKKIIY